MHAFLNKFAKLFRNAHFILNRSRPTLFNLTKLKKQAATVAGNNYNTCLQNT